MDIHKLYDRFCCDGSDIKHSPLIKLWCNCKCSIVFLRLGVIVREIINKILAGNTIDVFKIMYKSEEHIYPPNGQFDCATEEKDR